MKTLTLAVSAVTLALAGAAYAASGAAPEGLGNGPGMMMNKTITRAEAQTMAAAMFDKMDANRDGKLDKADHEAKLLERFKALDTDGNGQLSAAEFLAGHAKGEGMGTGMGAGMNEGPGMRGKMGAKMGGGKMGMGGHGREGMMMMHMADANKDGTVTRDEFIAAHLKHFDTMDTNKDGSLTPDERKAGMAKMGGMMGGKRGGPGGGMGDMPMDGPPPPPGN